MDIYILFAVLSALFFALMNVYDKYVLEKKIKNLYSYWGIVGLITVIYALIIIAFLDWSNLSLWTLIFPILQGIFLFISTYFYLNILKREDTSHMIGLIYLYPIIVAFLSFIFLKELLSWYGYVGVLATIVGALIISLRLKNLRTKTSIWYFVALILIIAVSEFLIKVSVSSINEWNSFAIASFVEGIITCFLFFRKDSRKYFKSEMRNIKWLLLGEVFTFFALATLYLAMSGIEAVVVSTISTMQVLFVLMLEWIFALFVGKMIRDKKFKHKIFATILIFIGILLMTI